MPTRPSCNLVSQSYEVYILTMSSPMPDFRLETASVTDALYESVRARIIGGEFAPGEKLTENRIATDYGVARTTAKACLERLIGIGLLQRSAHRSALIPRLGKLDIEDLFIAREAIEKFAVCALAQRGIVPQSARQAQIAIAHAADKSCFDSQVAADMLFHASLIQESQSVRLSRMHETITGEIHFTMGQYRAHRNAPPSSIVDEHEAILDAIEAGDVKLAQQHLIEHIHRARNRLLEAAAKSAASPD